MVGASEYIVCIFYYFLFYISLKSESALVVFRAINEKYHLTFRFFLDQLIILHKTVRKMISVSQWEVLVAAWVLSECCLYSLIGMDRVQCSGDLELAHQLQQEEDRKRKSEESRQEREEFQKLQVQKLITVLLSRVLISQIYFRDVNLCLKIWLHH